MSMVIRNISRQVEAGFIKVEYVSRNRRLMLRPWVEKLLEVADCAGTAITENTKISDLYDLEDCRDKVEEMAQLFGVGIKPYNKVMEIANKLRLQS